MPRSATAFLVLAIVACAGDPTPLSTSQGTVYSLRLQTHDGVALPGKAAVLSTGDFALQALAEAPKGRLEADLPHAGPWVLSIAVGELGTYVDWAFEFGESTLAVDLADLVPNLVFAEPRDDIFQEESELGKHYPGHRDRLGTAYRRNPIPSGQALLGDVNRNREVNSLDAILLFGHLIDPVNNPLGLYGYLGDIDQNGVLTWLDAAYLGAWLTDPSSNPFEIGELVDLRSAAVLLPSPEGKVFPNDHVWRTFRVQLVNVDSLFVEVNGPGTDICMEIAGGRYRPDIDYCPPEYRDRPNRYRQNAYKVHLAGCRPGETQIVLRDPSGFKLQTYNVTVESPGVEVDYPDTY